jgi:LysM repeat protein
MKFKLFLLTVILFTFSINVFARSAADSVGVENHKGKRIVIFKIKKKDTYYAIARHYHIDPKELQSYNDNAKMSIGHEIKVPTGKPYIEPKRHEKESAKNDKKKKKHGKHDEEQPEEQPAEQPQQVTVQAPPPQQQPQNQPVDNTPPTQYKVSPHETLYSIAKRFNTTVDNIMKLNNLSSNTISPGQVLLVGSNTPSTPAPIPAQERQADVVIAAKRDSTTMVSPQDSSNSNAYHMNANKYGLFEKDEKGVATWIDDAGLDPNKKLVLHRTAPIGTVIKITNVMTNRTTFAKVVGRFTDNEQTKDVVIVMTKNVAEALGALDKRFQVNISYGVPNEQ